MTKQERFEMAQKKKKSVYEIAKNAMHYNKFHQASIAENKKVMEALKPLIVGWNKLHKVDPMTKELDCYSRFHVLCVKANRTMGDVINELMERHIKFYARRK